MMMTASLNDNRKINRFEMIEAGQTVAADYRIAGERLFIDHVESPLALRGTGAAGRLMELIVARAEDCNLRIVPVCSYAAAWLQRRDES